MLSRAIRLRGLATTAGAALLVVFVISCLLTIHMLRRADVLAREEAGAAVAAVLGQTEEALELWLADRQGLLHRTVTDPHVVELVEALLAEPPPRGASNGRLDALRMALEHRLGRERLLGFFVIAPNRISVGSRRDANVGIVNLIEQQRPDLLRAVFAGESRFVPPVVSDVPLPDSRGNLREALPTAFVAAPVRNSAGEVIAAFTLRLDTHLHFRRLAALGRMGSTGETLAFDGERRSLTESRFFDGTLPILWRRIVLPGALAAEPSAATGHGVQQDTTGYQNYRGARVIGAWTWNEALGIGLLTEVDEDAALAAYLPVRLLVLWQLGLLGVLTASVTALLVVIARQREKKLQGVVAALRGDLSVATESRLAAVTALGERETLLREVHHRVKNDLSIISSLVSLELRELDADDPARASLQETASRIASVAALHEQLYEGDTPACVDFAPYLRTLVARRAGSLTAAHEIDVEAEELTLPADRAVACGLLANELITNAIKHGTVDAGGEGGPVRIAVDVRRDAQEIVLTVSDTGPGLPPDFELDAGRRLGLKVVAALTRQLNGEIRPLERDGNEGTTFELRFPDVRC